MDFRIDDDTNPPGYFDPLGLAENLTPEEFARVRAGEIKVCGS